MPTPLYSPYILKLISLIFSSSPPCLNVPGAAMSMTFGQPDSDHDQTPIRQGPQKKQAHALLNFHYAEWQVANDPCSSFCGMRNHLVEFHLSNFVATNVVKNILGRNCAVVEFLPPTFFLPGKQITKKSSQEDFNRIYFRQDRELRFPYNARETSPDAHGKKVDRWSSTTAGKRKKLESWETKKEREFSCQKKDSAAS